MTEPIIYTAQQAAAVLQVSLRTIERLTATGELPCRRIGRLVRYTPDDINHLISGSWYEAMSEREMMSVPAVSVPTTFVWGDVDIAIGATAAYACAEYVTGEFDFRVLEGRGHWLPDEDPSAVIDAIKARVGA